MTEAQRLAAIAGVAQRLLDEGIHLPEDSTADEAIGAVIQELEEIRRLALGEGVELPEHTAEGSAAGE